MAATLLDGKQLAKTLQTEIDAEVSEFVDNNGVTPTLAAVLVGEDPASDVYVRNKRVACEAVGIVSQLHRLPADIAEDDLLALVTKLNRADSARGKEDVVHGILVQLPLPPHLNARRVLHNISPLKDVDCFHPENLGRLVEGNARFLPCTPAGIQQLLIRNSIETAGKHVVVVGRGETVGKPLSIMLAQRGPGADATVTVCHSRTPDLAYFTRQADIVIAAAGKPRFITAEMIKPGATVVDVGIHRLSNDGGKAKLCGDVQFDEVSQIAGYITPVPGGVGPLTVTMLLANTLAAAREQEL